MSNRNTILEAILQAQPSAKPLPVLDYTAIGRAENLLAAFEECVVMVGGRVRKIQNLEILKNEIETEKIAGRFLINRLEGSASVDELPDDVSVLEKVERAYIKGSIGVAENGAVWVEETAMGKRILPFICHELVLVISEHDMVATMHDAYQRIRINKDGFGVFIAGPSKTADIEQSLVIGAHGPVALTVLVVP